MMKDLILISLILVLILTQTPVAIIGERSLFEQFVLGKGALRNELLDWVMDYTLYLKILYENHFIELLSTNPDPLESGIGHISNYLTFVMESVFISAILLIGTYILLISGSPSGRATAKSFFPGIIVGMVIIPVSPYIMKALLEISGSLTYDLISLNKVDFVRIFTEPTTYLIQEFRLINNLSMEPAMPFFLFSLFMLTMPIILLLIRYFLLVTFIALLPVTIFLYFFIPTRWAGKRIMELTLLWMFSQVSGALALISISGLILFLSPGGVGEIIVITGIAGSLALILSIALPIWFFKNFLPG